MISKDIPTDPTNLDEALRLIARLRAENAELHTMVDTIAGEHTAFLDEAHEQMFVQLFEEEKLFFGQDEEWDMHDAFTGFVQAWLDVAWDMANDERDDRAKA